ncbi:MAG: phospholipase D-like domain-containing protein [Candidatus Omnitrophota bacterium]
MQLRKPRFLSLCLLIISLAVSGCAVSPQKSAAHHTEVYFSPEGNIRSRIIKAIDNSRLSIDIAIFDFTSQEIKASLENAKKRGLKIRIIADSRQYKGAHSVVQLLIDSGFDVKIRRGKSRGIMHNKFAIFDKTLLFTGSYNWSDNAEFFNYENAIFISDTEVIRKYQKEFDTILSRD